VLRITHLNAPGYQGGLGAVVRSDESLALKGARCRASEHNVITAQVDVAHQATSKATAPLGAKISEVKQKNGHKQRQYIVTSQQEKYPHSRE
jgi:hypothetical protein